MDKMEPLAPSWQMMRLRDMLDARGIPWHDDSDKYMCRTKANEMREVKDSKGKPYEQRAFSVICGEHSYGGPELLECWVAGEADPIGYLTAEECVTMIEEATR